MKHVTRTIQRAVQKLVGFFLLLVFFNVPNFAHPMETYTPKSQAGKVFFILDGSGSMSGLIDNTEKIVIAKRVMIELVRQLPGSIETGLQVYGHRWKGDCSDIEIMVPMGKSDKEKLIQQINSINPKGKTPIAKSLELAIEALQGLEDETSVILISDGIETCGGDPCSLVKSLRQNAINFKVHVVGFDVNQQEQRQLMCIAEAGEGNYFTADNADQLRNALAEVKQKVLTKVETPKPVPIKKRVITMPMAETGKISLINSTLQVSIKDVQTGKTVGHIYPNGKPAEVATGTYRLTFGLSLVLKDEITVKAGDNIVLDETSLLGWISKPENTQQITIKNAQSGKTVGYLYPNSTKAVPLPPGIYQLKSRHFKLENLEIRPGEKIVIE